ncbi:hypothetical protein ES703_78324 [subsurface metagenome]
MEYAVLVTLDLDVKVLDSTKAEEVEKITENVVRMHLDGSHGVKIKMLRTKLLGLSKDKP